MSGKETKRIALTVQYDGEPYFGWQLQSSQASVQGELEAVLTRIFNTPTRLVGAGRTDRGVHATGQVAAVDAPARWSADEIRRTLNALLPRSIWIGHAAEAAPTFHPRYDAVSRRYVYRVGTAELAASPFHSRWCWPVCRPLRLDAMASATAALIGNHSFRAFAKAGQEKRGDRCDVTQASWQPWGEVGVELHIAANRFLHHMVRYLVGTLVAIGLDRRPVDDVAGLLQGRADLLTSPPAPPEGLYLTAVEYPAGLYSAPLTPSGVETGPSSSPFEGSLPHGRR